MLYGSLYQLIIMKLSSIIRRSLPFTPSRAGIPPTWDRPDPPATKKFPRNHYQSTQQKHFTFFDSASPTFMLVNPEVAEGDLGEALPSFVKNLFYLVLTGAAVGFISYFYANRPSVFIFNEYNYEVDKLEQERTLSEQKYGLKDLLNNPWKLNVWPESFPIANLGVQDRPSSFEPREQNIDKIRRINKEAQAYWGRLRAEAEKSLQSGHGHH